MKPQPTTPGTDRDWFDALDPAIQREIEEAEAAFDRGEEGIPAEDVIAHLRRRTADRVARDSADADRRRQG